MPDAAPPEPRTPATLGLVRAFNNNVVVAKDDAGREYVLMGRGIGFGAKAHDRIASSSAERIFRPTEGEAAERIVSLLSELSPEHLLLADGIANLAKERLGYTLTSALVIPLADHLAMALRRADESDAVELPLVSEVRYAFPAETQVAKEALELIEHETGIRLPADEASAIALHLVNASFSGDMSTTFLLARTMAEALEIVRLNTGVEVDTSSLSVARFATHLRYLLARLQNGSQQKDSAAFMWRAAMASHPVEHACAVQIGRVIGERLKVDVLQQEELYLTLHVLRLLDRT